MAEQAEDVVRHDHPEHNKRLGRAYQEVQEKIKGGKKGDEKTKEKKNKREG